MNTGEEHPLPFKQSEESLETLQYENQDLKSENAALEAENERLRLDHEHFRGEVQRYKDQHCKLADTVEFAM